MHHNFSTVQRVKGPAKARHLKSKGVIVVEKSYKAKSEPINRPSSGGRCAQDGFY